MTTQPTPGALRAVKALNPWLASPNPQEPEVLALIIDRETGITDLVTAAKAVMEWWDLHKNDVWTDEEDEGNLYDEPPEFVKLAESAIVKAEGRT